MPRPSSFKPEYVEQAFNYSLLGCTDVQLAAYFSVSEATISTWKLKQPEFLEALKDGKERADAAVSKSLYKRATGYELTEQVPTKVKEIIYNDEGKKLKETEVIVLTEVTKTVSPDTTAMIFWLKNRRKEHWRDRQEVTGADGGPIETTTLTYMPKQLPDDYFNKASGNS